MRRLAALAALAVLAAVPLPAGAAPRTHAGRLTVDGAMVVGWDDPRRPTAGVVVTFVRYTHTGGADELYHCVSYGTRTVNESGCATLPPSAVTAGLVHPETATLRGRVPMRERRGGWVDVDLTLAAADPPAAPTPNRGTQVDRYEALPGVEAPRGATLAAGAYVIRRATVSGTVRTDRGLRFAPVPHPKSLLQPVLIRWDLTTVELREAHGAVAAAFGEAAAALLPA